MSQPGHARTCITTYSRLPKPPFREVTTLSDQGLVINSASNEANSEGGEINTGYMMYKCPTQSLFT